MVVKTAQFILFFASSLFIHVVAVCFFNFEYAGQRQISQSLIVVLKNDLALSGAGKDADSDQLRNLSSAILKSSSHSISTHSALAETGLDSTETDARSIQIPVMRAGELLPSAASYFSEGIEKIKDVVPRLGYFDAEQVDRRARALDNLILTFPRKAYEERRSGKAVVELLISETGALDKCTLIAASPDFADTAKDGLCNIRFAPAEMDDKPVRSRMLVELNYLLLDPAAGISEDESVMLIDTANKKRVP